MAHINNNIFHVYVGHTLVLHLSDWSNIYIYTYIEKNINVNNAKCKNTSIDILIVTCNKKN